LFEEDELVSQDPRGYGKQSQIRRGEEEKLEAKGGIHSKKEALEFKGWRSKVERMSLQMVCAPSWYFGDRREARGVERLYPARCRWHLVDREQQAHGDAKDYME
jgi:hypothetical protein